MLYADVLRQRLLQFANLRSHNEVSMSQHTLNTLIDFRFVAPVLFFDVYEFHVSPLAVERWSVDQILAACCSARTFKPAE